MGEIINFIEIYTIETILGLGVGILLLLILYIISQIRISNIRKKYDLLVNGTTNMNIEELLIKAGKDVNDMRMDMNVFHDNIKALERNFKFAVQKVGFIRYNAFAEMGSDLSFSIALLDSFQNGFVLTSIYGRDYSSLYAKPIKKGKSKYELSVEEMQAIDRAKVSDLTEKTL